MKKQLLASVLFPVCALAHNFLFWGEKMGLNALLFAIIMIPALFFLHPEAIKSKQAIISAFGVLLTAVMVILNNSFMAKTTHILFFIAMIGFVQCRELRFIFYAFCLGVVSLFDMRIKMLKEVFRVGKQPTTQWRLASQSRMMMVVAPVFVLFFIMYFKANEQFAELSSYFFIHILNYILETFSWERLISLAISVIVAGSLLWKTSSIFFQKWQARQTPILKRERNKQPALISAGTNSLKTEFRTAVLMFSSLNLLLLIVNLVDINYVWFGEISNNPLKLKQFVHEGTYILIAAILSAMGVILYYFRRNLNFLPGNQIIKYLAYAWIAQNAVLALSVGARNYYYINACGLAYKRIGVFIFLLLTIYGLWTLFIKISKKKSFYYLWFQNGWAFYTVLLLVSFVNWDVFITRYNINTQASNPIDARFLVEEVSDKNLFLLTENKEKIAQNMTLFPYGNLEFSNLIDRKWERFAREQAEYSWLSWNLTDQRNLVFMKTHAIEIVK